MSCGAIALKQANLPIDSYDAFEIDEPAIQTTAHNFPFIKNHGDVFEGDFTQFEGVDLLCGGSPCTHWSIAQTKNRETEASGLGWELFSQYVRALKEAKPKYFIYENNASMSEAIQISISNTFGFDPVCINSALVSAQSRNRLYWVGKRESDGIYSKVNVVQPADRGILLKDILDGAMDLTSNDKSWTLTASYDGACAWNTIERNQRNMCVEPVNTTNEGKSQTVKAQMYKTAVSNICKYTSTYGASGVAEMVANQVGAMPRPNGELSTSQGFRIYDTDSKSVTLKGNAGGAGGKTGLYAVPVYEFTDINIRDTAHITINDNAIRGVQNDAKASSCAENFYEFTDRKANTLTTAHTPKIIDEYTNYQLYSQPCEWDTNGIPTKAISQSDGKTYTVYTVANGMITIRDKDYPIKLADGFYIIRKLSINECKRLQTIPDWYEFPVSNTAAYKMLGNGWTVEVIVHLLKCIFDPEYKKTITTTIKSSQKRLF